MSGCPKFAFNEVLQICRRDESIIRLDLNFPIQENSNFCLSSSSFRIKKYIGW